MTTKILSAITKSSKQRPAKQLRWWHFVNVPLLTIISKRLSYKLKMSFFKEWFLKYIKSMQMHIVLSPFLIEIRLCAVILKKKCYINASSFDIPIFRVLHISTDFFYINFAFFIFGQTFRNNALPLYPSISFFDINRDWSCLLGLASKI